VSYSLFREALASKLPEKGNALSVSSLPYKEIILDLLPIIKCRPYLAFAMCYNPAGMSSERLTLCATCPEGQPLFAGISQDQTNAVLFCAYGEDTCSVEATAIHHQETNDIALTGVDAPVLKTYAIIYGCGRPSTGAVCGYLDRVRWPL